MKKDKMLLWIGIVSLFFASGFMVGWACAYNYGFNNGWDIAEYALRICN